MMYSNNTRDVERESVLSLLNYSQYVLKSADSETSPASIPISGENVQFVAPAGIPALLINSIYKLVASFPIDSTYDGGGIGGTGHATDNDVPTHNAAVANTYQGGGIGGSGNAPDDTKFRRPHVSQLDALISDVVESGGIGGTGHADDGAKYPQEVTAIVALADTGGGIGGSGHTPDILPSDTCAVVASGDETYHLPPATVINNSMPVVILDSASSTNVVDGAQVVTDLNSNGVNVLQQVFDSMLPDNQADDLLVGHPETITDMTSVDALTVNNLLVDEIQLLPDDSDTEVLMEPENYQTSILPVLMYESFNDLCQGSSQPVIC